MMQLGPFPSINCSLQAQLIAVARDDTSVLKEKKLVQLKKPQNVLLLEGIIVVLHLLKYYQIHRIQCH